MNNSVFGIQLFINNITVMLQTLTNNTNTNTDNTPNTTTTTNTNVLICYFQQLLSERAMDYSKGISNRQMKQSFILNMKEFLQYSKPLLTYN